ncbi:MAG: YbiU family protein [Granulosicoccus sp.]
MTAIRTLTQTQAEHFKAGKSPPDFAAEDYEIDFRDRATVDDLSPLGLRQMAR